MGNNGLGIEITELRLGLPGGGSLSSPEKGERKRVFWEIAGDGNVDRKCQKKNEVAVGWPPVCSYRRKSCLNSEKDEVESSKMYVKVSMDGVPFLRKLDLRRQIDYSELATALETLFSSSGIGGSLKDAESSEFLLIYEDRDGDWLLVGDVPWEMFVESCKRLRIMKRSEAKGFGLHTKIFLEGTTQDGSD